MRHAEQNLRSQVPIKGNHSRQVHYHLGQSFFDTPPNCIMVLPIISKELTPNISRAVEEAVSRHLSIRFNRVIGVRHVLAETRRRGLDPFYKDDLRRFASEIECNSYAEIDAAQVDRVFALVWTEISASIGLIIVRASDGEVLWRGNHTARRGDGSLPLSTFGVGLGALAAGRLAGDGDALPSIVDDTIRRMMVSLPDVRNF